MRVRSRWLAATGVAALGALVVPVLVSSAAVWNIGDVFIGIGRLREHPGEYLVRTPTGAPKETVIDPWAGRTAITTGCAIAPSGALYATPYQNKYLAKFADGTHAATPIAVPPTAAVGSTVYTIDATESIVFHPDGSYYVGAMVPSRHAIWNEIPPYAFILKYSASDELVATYAVPNETRGADWIDLTVNPEDPSDVWLYYTSEGRGIHRVKPGPDAPGVQVLTEADGWPRQFSMSGTVYGIRVLPLLPDGEPSGFLVAHSSGAFRATPDGRAIKGYAVPAHVLASQFFALNFTPDGQSFWTATFKQDPDDDSMPRAGRVFRYHIASGDLTALIDTGAPSVWGLCVKREFTAAGNVCHQDNGDGTYGPGTFPCHPIEFCEGGLDEDGDRKIDLADEDCQAIGRPTFQPQPQSNRERDTISLQLVAADPNNQPLTYSVSPQTPLPPGLSMSAGGLITGMLTSSSAGTYTILVLVSDGMNTVAGQFAWTVLDDPANLNDAPLCTAARPSQAVWPPVHRFVPVNILGVTDPDGDPVTIAITGIWQDEPVDGTGDGRTDPDGRIDGVTAWVRAERIGVTSVPGDGRIYEIKFQASDGNPGGTCAGSVLVGVPHDQAQKQLPTDSMKRWNSMTGQFIQ